MPLTHLLFDLDDTLYPPEAGVWEQIRARINRYMIERVGLSPESAGTKREHYFLTYGTTLNGLMREYHIDPADFLAYVHDLPLEQYLRPVPALDAMLSRLPYAKAIFTNANVAHAQRVLAQLGVAQHFGRIVDICALDYINKPDPRAYPRALDLLGLTAAECLLLDDQPRNLAPAHALGMKTVLVNPRLGDRPAGVDFQIQSVLELEGVGLEEA